MLWSLLKSVNIIRQNYRWKHMCKFLCDGGDMSPSLLQAVVTVGTTLDPA